MNTTIDTVGGFPMGGMMGNNCYDGNQWFWLIILFLFVFMGRGNMWGNGNASTIADIDANGAMTRAAVNEGFQFNQLDNGIRGLERGQCNLGYTMLEQSNGTNMAIKDAAYSNQFALMNGFNQTERMLAENRFAQQQCCCDTNRNIDAVRWEASKNTCDIINAIRDDGSATRALLNDITMQNLRDKLADKDRELFASNMQISQVRQTNQITSDILGALQPPVKPAYVVGSPYESIFQPQYGFGFGWGYNGYNGYGGCCGNNRNAVGCCN